MTTTSGQLPIHVLRGETDNAYQAKVVYTYADDPQAWRKALGENILFEWGIYNHPDSPRPVSLDESGVRFFDRQLELAGLTGPDRPPLRRILDLGCGWGFILGYLARLFPECGRLDGLNISRSQLEYCAEHLAGQGIADRTNLYQCNAQDLALLPEPEQLYDLVVIRGVITHFPHALFESSMAALACRVREGGLLVISDTLYKGDLDDYQSAIPDEVDRLAVGYRKTPEYFSKVLEDSGFAVTDMRVLPSNADVAHWLLEVRSNLETHFPDGVTGPLEELRVLAVNLSIALLLNKVSAYSVIAQRTSEERKQG
ncbi:methyltransferase domain-containing protein [Crossiella sp. SN42]|uniref:SAM-dependent methyltransferase n=1 Tax=Crossiella sp. SN42 TaxID=2944808 RepID=UPI00207C4081|nr:class I SAM-dependent methyltransferase [Crossiella sp. SN42]MCO1581663.1 methyltransferase domain-containing protein [Crossiella sp. SN42]